MAFNIPEHCYAYLPAQDLSGSVGYAVRISTTGGDPDMSVRLCDQTNAARFLGVVLYGAKAYNAAPAVELISAPRTATIQTGGIAKAVAQAAVNRGDMITVHTDGRFRAAATGEAVVGEALTSVTNAGDIFALQLAPRPTTAP